MSRGVFLLFSFVWLVVAAGCSDPYAGRLEVTGAITLQGKPLKDGAILFEPLAGQGTQSGGPIVNGEYRVPQQSGLKPGNYLVRLTAGDGKTPANSDEIAGPGGSTNIISMDLIPDDWNTRSQHQVEVKAGAPNRFNFDIPNVNTRKRK